MLNFVSPKRLRERGVLGMNQRNADFILRYNSRKHLPLVDDKLRTKELAQASGIHVPPLYGVLVSHAQVHDLQAVLGKADSMVIKPAQGSGGNGILVIEQLRMPLGIASEYHYMKASGEPISLEQIQHHCSNILSGMYSLSGARDKVIIEYRVQSESSLAALSYKGVADIRVIVFRGVPVAAMMRLPTRRSDGKANLHQGAVGVGIDLASGSSKGAVYDNHVCRYHPDIGADLHEVRVPQWSAVLELAIHCADQVGLGYLGVDIVIDQSIGPMMLELNARPGLGVQVANRDGLLHSLKWIESQAHLPASVDARLALAQQLSASLI